MGSLWCCQAICKELQVQGISSVEDPMHCLWKLFPTEMAEEYMYVVHAGQHTKWGCGLKGRT